MEQYDSRCFDYLSMALIGWKPFKISSCELEGFLNFMPVVLTCETTSLAKNYDRSSHIKF